MSLTNFAPVIVAFAICVAVIAALAIFAVVTFASVILAVTTVFAPRLASAEPGILPASISETPFSTKA